MMEIHLPPDQVVKTTLYRRKLLFPFLLFPTSYVIKSNIRYCWANSFILYIMKLIYGLILLSLHFLVASCQGKFQAFLLISVLLEIPTRTSRSHSCAVLVSDASSRKSSSSSSCWESFFRRRGKSSEE